MSNEVEVLKKIIVGWTGASGVIYGERLVQALLVAGCEVHLVYSAAAELVYQDEIGFADGETLWSHLQAKFANQPLVLYDNNLLASSIASGSYPIFGMVVAPCSMATLSGIAIGAANSLLKRAADVMLKERRPLIIVPRETPLSLIHLRNMTMLTEAGAMMLPAMPAFYHHPQTIDDMVNFVVGKVLDLLSIEHQLFQRYEP
ncbi:MAG: UbiX family flavin prenyltransferase [Methylocystaceae bacterium]